MTLARADATVIGYRAAARAARAIPVAATSGASTALGHGAAVWSTDQRRMLERHLRRVDPSLDRRRLRAASRRSYASYVRYWIESLRLPHLRAAAVDRGMRTDGYRTHLLDALGRGRGVILALPHLGGWEWAGRWLIDQGHGVTVVVERVEPPELFDWFVGLRSSLGMHVVPLGPTAGREILAALARNDVVCLLCDRDIARRGVPVNFFGEATTLPAGPATIALRSGAPLLPTAVYFTDRHDGHLGLVRPPVESVRTEGRLRDDVERVTQRLATELEALIRRAPTQWHLLQPNWPSDPGYGIGSGGNPDVDATRERPREDRTREERTGEERHREELV